MWFGAKEPRDISFWRRFHTAAEGFTVLEESGYWTLQVVVGAERAVDLFLGLLTEFSGPVSVAIEDAHAKRSWTGGERDATAVRAAFAPLREPLLADGGVELTVFTISDQVTLNPVREIFIYAKSGRWRSVLEGKGIEEQRLVRTQSWRTRGRDLPPSPVLSDAVAAAVRALALETA
jgi:hypothetical protein